MFIATANNRWHVHYNGPVDELFVDAWLIEPNNTSDEEIIMITGGQSVDFAVGETVEMEIAKKAAVFFAQTGKLLQFEEKYTWEYINQIPLED